MPELARTLVSRLREFVGNRRRARRCPARLAFSVTPADRYVISNGSRQRKWMEGHTFDVSTSGLALVVPAIRIGEHYLVGDDRKLLLRLELPTGTVEMQVAPVRYESLEEHPTEQGYVIGVRITDVDPQIKAGFESFVRRLLRSAPLD